MLRNRANSLRVELSKSADSGKLARIESDGRVLEWSLDGMPTAAAPVVRQGAQIKQARLVARAQATPLFVGRTRASLEKADLSILETEAEKRADLTATMDSDATYENVLPGLSVRYTLHGQTLKEDLILANAAAQSHAALRLPDTYDYEAMDDGSVSVRDKATGESIFVFEAPYVYDAENAEIPATVVLAPVSDGVRMHYELDEEALAQAAFPVTIDPLIRSANANKYTEFTCLADGQGLPYSQAQDHIKTGAYNGKQCVGMLRFLSLAPLEASDTVIQAQLCMYSKNRSTSNYIGVYSVNSDWNKANVAWTNFDPHDESKMGQDAIECQKGPAASYIPIQFDITNLYRKWCMTDESGNSQNFGVAFHAPRNVPGANYTELYASNAAADRQPVLYLYYVSHAGLESWWQYESGSAGRAGTVYTDLFNGNMVLDHTDTTMTGNLMPVSVSHYYNSCLSDSNDYACGKGWKTSAHQKVTREKHNNINYFVWEDGDGTQHYFKDEGAQPFKDEEGMDLKLYLYNSDGYIVISDKKHNRMRFDIRESGLAWLVAERDALSNEVTYEYVSGYEKQGRISKITDPAGRETVFTYSNNLLSDISIPDTDTQRAKHLLLRERTPEKVVNYHDYNNHGSRTSSRCVDYRVTTNNTAETAYPYIRTEQTYTADGNFALDAKDARGNTVTRSTNTRTGELNSVTDPTGQTINYTYDDAKRVTGVETTGDGKTYRNAYTYEEDRIKTTSHNTTDDMVADVTYTFDYDDLGRKTTVRVGTQTLSTNVYEEDRSDLLSSVQYGNGGKVSYTYDDFDRMVGVKYDAETAPRYEYKYGANGEAAEVVDHVLNRTARTDYDQADRPCQTELRDNATGEALYKTNLKYNKLNQLEMFSEQADGETHKTEFAYDRDNRVTGITYDGSAHKVNYTYDELGRVASRAAECGADAGKLTSTYEYVDGGYGTNSTTPLVKKIAQNGVSFEYEYDSRGNIISEKRGNLTTTYQYDALGQLIRVNDPHENATWVYNYDRGGNITSKVKYAYTTGTVGTAIETIPYVYGDSNWKDKLTSYNGQTITYDAIGNPLNDGTWTYTWQAGRQLKQMSAEGTSVSFKYDHNGLRTQKVVEQSWYPETTRYILHGKNITHMTVDYTDWSEVSHQDELHFFYDERNYPAKVEFNGTVYTYLPSLQGDIIGILDSNGSLVVEYKYDAWGKPLSTTGTLADTLGKRNPFRYRSYIYDEETGLYYLETRYYNPEQCRFLGADEYLEQYISLVHNNAYAYCINNPVSKEDRDGQFFRELFSGGSAAVGGSWIVGSALIGIINTVKTAAVTVASVVTAITPVGWVAIGATAVLVTGAVLYAKRNKAKKTTKKSGKEKASDKPSWVNKDMVDKSLTPEENIRKWLNEKYGEGNWGKGPGSEYSQIKKWITRTEGVYYDSVHPSPRSAK